MATSDRVIDATNPRSVGRLKYDGWHRTETSRAEPNAEEVRCSGWNLDARRPTGDRRET